MATSSWCVCILDQTLGLAAYMFDNETYAEHAMDISNQWFLDPATRMNPNLNFAAFRPGINEGDASGIISTV